MESSTYFSDMATAYRSMAMAAQSRSEFTQCLEIAADYERQAEMAAQHERRAKATPNVVYLRPRGMRFRRGGSQ
jgi:hypothetical protein